MASKVRVHGKAQNRTALGIVHAYVVMYPHATLDDLRKAFPNSVCPDSGVKELFLPVSEAEKFNTKMSLYFAKPDEVINLADGSQIALSQVWSKPSFERIVEQGKLYDVEVAEFEKTAHPGQKGGYRLEYLNGYVPPVSEQPKKKSSLMWLWILLVLILAGIIAWLALRPAEKEVVEVEKVIEKVVEKEVVVRDTVYVLQIEDIQKDFNAAQFAKGKADLTDDAKEPLFKLADLMKKHPEMKLKIVGHTSAEGTPEVNQKLSEARAKAASDFLVSRGIDEGRISYDGKGSSELLNAENPMAEENRRTEFIIEE